MLIEVRLLARLFRIPLLRVEGAVVITDPDDLTGRGGNVPSLDATVVSPAADLPASRAPAPRVGTRPRTPFGSDLAAAEAVMADLRGPGESSRRAAS
ncbi:hypothetical protein GCM10009809_25200 [Isoptericola hypogeus]|uniref:Uncharacterized protein n=1 Tax=Isoptericola hypogeus TaxID=300179 RepID=A0ABP4VL03_9MICO